CPPPLHLPPPRPPGGFLPGGPPGGGGGRGAGGPRAPPMSGAGTGLALVGAYLLAGELAAAEWDPEAGFAGYEARMRSFVEANQEIGRLHAESRAVPRPDAEPAPEPDMEALTALIERAINGVALPDYTGVPDSGALAGPPIASSARP
ncbi:hypothetical protein ACFWY9_21720, partial [Amycolatopsis sp. NPDC059027]